MTIEYICHQCGDKVIATGPEVGVPFALTGPLVVLNNHMTETGHARFGYASEHSDLTINVSGSFGGRKTVSISGERRS